MSNTRNKPGRAGGFTLVELLASMALLALIAVMVFTIFNQATKVWQKAGARSEQYIAARTTLEQIAREIQGATLIGQNRFAGAQRGLGWSGQFLRLQFN